MQAQNREASPGLLPRSRSGARVRLAHLLISLGAYIQSLALAVMRAEDLVAFGRQTYSRVVCVEQFSRGQIVDAGLHLDEQALLAQLGLTSGSVLVLGMGGGREAIAFARTGLEVTGVDFVPEMVERTQANASRHGVHIQGLVQEISHLDVPAASYDLVWLSSAMYSAVPTRSRRVEMLRRVGDALASDGHAVVQFYWDTSAGPSSRIARLGRRMMAWLTLGDLSYEPGDRLLDNAEFIHGFRTKEELESEFEAAGLECVHLRIPDGGVRGGAILRKP